VALKATYLALAENPGIERATFWLFDSPDGPDLL
jgi:hypothetical protein